jgi:hypothetical protein
MFTALLSFLGGSAFRMIFGEISSWMNKRQDHEHELERIRLDAQVQAAQHKLNMEAIKTQAELGVQAIRVQGEATANQLEIQGWAAAVANSNKPTGVAWVDAWNGTIRPAAATVVLALWIGSLVRQNFAMTEWDQMLAGVVLGYFFASRDLIKRGK